MDQALSFLETLFGSSFSSEIEVEHILKMVFDCFPCF